MKNLFFNMVAVLLTATFGFGQSNSDLSVQFGDGNYIDVVQVGLDNDNTIFQTGDYNIAETDQDGWANVNTTTRPVISIRLMYSKLAGSTKIQPPNLVMAMLLMLTKMVLRT